MPLVSKVGRKAFPVRSFGAFVYASLIIMGVTMVVPFLITVSSTATNDFDYNRFLPVPRSLWSQPDRFMKGLVYYYNGYRNCFRQMRCAMPVMPEQWTGWMKIGNDVKTLDALAAPYISDDTVTMSRRARIAADYSEFFDNYPLEDTLVTVINPQAVDFMKSRYLAEIAQADPEYSSRSRNKKEQAALSQIGRAWGIPYESFYTVSFRTELNAPLEFQTYFPSGENPKYQDFIRLKQAYRDHMFTPGVAAKWAKFLRKTGYNGADAGIFPVSADASPELRRIWCEFKAGNAPASPCVPFMLRAAWYQFLGGENAAKLVNIPDGQRIDVELYNRLTGGTYRTMWETPFPLPPAAPAELHILWRYFVEKQWPLRLSTLKVDDELNRRYQKSLAEKIRDIAVANRLLGMAAQGWSGFTLSAVAPQGDSDTARARRTVWINFVQTLEMEKRKVTCAEIAYQDYLSAKYGSLEKINQTYGWNLRHIEEAFPPVMDAYAVTFANNQWAFTFEPIIANYRVVFDYLLLNARAVPVTLLLIALTIVCTLTINPLAAYALSRFQIRGQGLIILFMLATMAFPTMVSAIPAYLLMRDLGLLNTFFALVLPGAANGMAIFILKGFFDSLPQELFEAATIDGASELQIFRIVAMPLVKPILAVNALSAFIMAYNGWEWALIICQKQEMWTIAVWMYQASVWWKSMPWIVSAGFVICSVPTLLVFIFCQKMILKGIVIPSMK